MSVRKKVLFTVVVLLLLQLLSLFLHYFMLRSYLIDRWREEASAVAGSLASHVAVRIKDDIDKARRTVELYSSLPLEALMWKITSEVVHVKRVDYMDSGGRYLKSVSRFHNVPRYVGSIGVALREEQVGEVRDEYGETYLVYKLPDMRENVHRGFFLLYLSLKDLLWDVLSTGYPGKIGIVLKDSRGSPTVELSGSHVPSPFTVSYPVRGYPYHLELFWKREDVLAPADKFLQSAGIFGVTTTAFLLFILFLVVYRTFRPLEVLTQEVINYSGSFTRKGVDELDILSRAFENLLKGVEREKETYRKLWQEIGDGMLLVRDDGTVAMVNAQLEMRFGVKGEEMVGMEVSRIFPGLNPKVNTFISETDMLVKGKRYTVSLRIFPVSLEDGVYHLIHIKDLTLQKEMEYVLSRHVRLNIAGEIAVSIAHQLNNPLASILASAEVLMSRLQDDTLKPLVQRIVDNTARASQTVRKLLDISGSKDGSPSKVNPATLTEGVVDMMLYKARKKGVKLEYVNFLKENITLFCYPWKLEQILMNLVDNAIDETPQGGYVRVTLEEVRGGLVWSVKDSGKGVREDILDRIFEPFFTTKVEGYGLGLSIVKRFVEDMGGRVEVINHPDGAEFRVILRLGEGYSHESSVGGR
ncbi:multi-sensor signal transduction histidine kinase [Thermocrinis albus DSM 14484]|uniref:histidine kinase n=1 Tax=Thermocrinis albus (strain DSM 14484 / JCM 11386 / HI 11/12) TaxID=638303 RepID=D3SPP6_THEAH|nr:PAS domain-containing sensor histidine kinase [Thermocrinis albus]ADC89133.1 multi-sensor signal transduction histidine kinase [Thermocrinis albus DSM 14484]